MVVLGSWDSLFSDLLGFVASVDIWEFLGLGMGKGKARMGVEKG